MKDITIREKIAMGGLWAEQFVGGILLVMIFFEFMMDVEMLFIVLLGMAGITGILGAQIAMRINWKGHFLPLIAHAILIITNLTMTVEGLEYYTIISYGLPLGAILGLIGSVPIGRNVKTTSKSDSAIDQIDKTTFTQEETFNEEFPDSFNKNVSEKDKENWDWDNF